MSDGIVTRQTEAPATQQGRQGHPDSDGKPSTSRDSRSSIVPPRTSNPSSSGILQCPSLDNLIDWRVEQKLATAKANADFLHTIDKIGDSKTYLENQAKQRRISRSFQPSSDSVSKTGAIKEQLY